jgi:peptidoglycan/xylan/chitin deacetylase (PgdA/CDA1 family)
MRVVRRFTLVVGLLASLLVPATVGGSDVARAAREGSEAPALVAPPAAPPVAKAVKLWSPGHGPHTRFQPAGAPRELILSFDDGPDLNGTPLILEELDRRGLKAIFFVTGWRLMGRRPDDIARRDLIRKIAAHGHLVANHTMNHHDLCQNPTEQAAEIDSNNEVIAQATGVRPLLFRSPYGAFCQSLQATLAAREMPDIGWNIDPQDWKSGDEEAVYAYLTQKLSQLKGRGILLLHDTHSASVHALPRLLDWLARDNVRAARAGHPPVKIIDYSVLVPQRPVTASGLPELVGALVADAVGAVGRHIH